MAAATEAAPFCVTVTVSVTVEVAAPPPLLTQMTTTSLMVFCSMSTVFPLPLLLLSSLLLYFWLLLDLESPLDPLLPLLSETSTPTAPLATSSACRVPAKANGAAHNAATAENLMMIDIK